MTDVVWVLRTGTRLLGASARRRSALALLAATAAAAAAVGLSMVSAWLIVRASEQPPVLHLMVAIVAVRALGLGRGVLRYVDRLVGHDLALRVLTEFRGAVVGALADAVPGVVAAADEERDPGRVLAGVVDDVDALVDAWVRVALPLAAAVVVGGGVSLGLALVDPVVAGVLLVSVALAVTVGPAAAVAARRRHETHLAPLRSDLAATTIETLSAASELAVLGHLGSRIAAADEVARAMRDVQLRDARRAGRSSAASTLVAAAGGAAVLLLAGRVESTESVAVAVFGLLAVHEVVALAVQGLQRVPSISASARRIRRLLDTRPGDTDVDPSARAPAVVESLTVAGLRARWPGSSGDDVSLEELEARAGHVTVVVGPSGGGKSTLAAVVSGALRPTEGSVVLAGQGTSVDTRRLTRETLRAVVLWAPQDVIVFDTSLRENLRFARPDADDDALLDSLDRAGLGEWVVGLPHGLDTRLDASRDVVSGGQARRMGVARALLADRPVTVFDEPTEHLDDETAHSIAAVLTASARDRVVIVVTHRPDLFPSASVITLSPTVTVARFSDQGPE